MENFSEVYIRLSKRLKFTSAKQSLEEMIHVPNHLTLQEPAQTASEAALRDLLVSQMPQQFCSVGNPGRFPPGSYLVMNFWVAAISLNYVCYKSCNCIWEQILPGNSHKTCTIPFFDRERLKGRHSLSHRASQTRSAAPLLGTQGRILSPLRFILSMHFMILQWQRKD